MRLYRTIAPLSLLTVLLAVPAGASLEEARRLIAEERLGAARAALAELLATGPDAERAEALALLGALAVREGDLAAASAAWTELGERFPGTASALQGAAGLALMGDLLACRGEAPAELTRTAEAAAEATPPAAPAAPEPAPSPSPEVPEPTPAAETPEPSPAAETPEPTPAAVPAARTQVAGEEPPEPAAGAVWVAGDGIPPEVIEEVVELFAEHLLQAGVEAAVAPQTVWWRRSWEMAEPGLLQGAAEARAAGVVWIDMRFGFREKLRVRCFTPDGREAFDERASGGSYYTDHRPHDRYNEDLVERLQGKMAEHVGGACLPVGP